jgi:heme/copper-type cytochrome/quinol oxidase subunit 3
MTTTTTPEHTGAAAPTEAHHTSTGLSNEKLAMWVFLGSECLLFGGLISTFLLYRESTPLEGPTIESLYDIPYTSVSSFVLLMSSLTMVLAVSAIKRGDQRNTRVWLMTTALLGASFVAGQVYEFTVFYREGLGYTTNLQGSAFYTLTGFHGVHVSIGIIMLLSCVVLSLRGRMGPERSESIEIVGLYWHFVDVVWIVIFTVVYLITP